MRAFIHRVAGLRPAPNNVRYRILISLLFICLLTESLIVRPAAAEAPTADLVSDDWQFTVTPYLWALTLDGDVTVKGNKSDVDMDFSEIWDNLNVAVMFEADARKNRLGLFLNPLYAELEDDTDILGIDVDMAIVNLGGYYRLGPWPLNAGANGSGASLVMDLYAGARYTYLYAKLKGKRFGFLDKDSDQDWIDPIVGVRTLWHFSPKWRIVLSGDIGGFDVGSDFTWQATAAVGYGVKLLCDTDARFYAGYRALGQDYSDGSGSDKFEWDTTFHGPVIGMSFRF